MSGWVRIIGLGPGPEKWLSPEARDVLAQASDVFGYTPYAQTARAYTKAALHPSDNGDEIARAKEALAFAQRGARAAVVSGGDAGVFGMASAVFEAMEQGDAAWRALDVEVIPGMSAMLAAAALAGAPLGHDFCVISLSDRLKPWSIIERRLRAACAGDFAIALYNPASHTRTEQVKNAIALLERECGAERIIVLASNVGRAQERMVIATLATLDSSLIDMRTLLLVGSSRTRLIAREGKAPLVYTPRFYAEDS